MTCPKCGHSELSVLEKRDIEDGVRRRRLCQNCDHRFTTYERCEIPSISVIKRSGQREHYDERKVRQGMEMACKNRPVHPEQLSMAAGRVTQALRSGEHEVISSNQIGDLVLEELRLLDLIAYMRFVSVHHSFTDLDTFKREIQRLEKLSK